MACEEKRFIMSTVFQADYLVADLKGSTGSKTGGGGRAELVSSAGHMVDIQCA